MAHVGGGGNKGSRDFVQPFMAPEQGKRGDLTSGSLLRRKDAIIKWRKNALHGIFSPPPILFSRKILRGQGNKRQQ